jgi:hypothetical protein
MSCTEIIIQQSFQQTPTPEEHEIQSISPHMERPQDQDTTAIPPYAQNVVERWNHPKSNIARLAFAFLTSIVAGMNDAAVGVGHLQQLRLVQDPLTVHSRLLYPRYVYPRYRRAVF